jgi:membrane protein YqaA with SNARE-associated domain
MTQPPDEPALVEPELVVAGKRGLLWRADFALLAFSALLVTAFAFAFFYFEVDFARLRTYGYVGVFAIGSGAIRHPILGVPAPVAVGLVAGLGEAIGEFTGYAAGYGGSAVIRERAFYRAMQQWMHKNGSVIMFVFSAIPNPIFDVAGTIAGAVKMPLWKFFVSVWLGKTLKDIVIAATGVASLTVIQHIFE